MSVRTYEPKTPHNLRAAWFTVLWLVLSTTALAQEPGAVSVKGPAPEAAQVRLHIRVAEVDRLVMRELSSIYGVASSTIPASIRVGGPGQVAGQAGSSAETIGLGNPGGPAQATSMINLLLNGANGPESVLGFIRALQTRGALRELAVRSLDVVEQRQTSFLAGGQFPIPFIEAGHEGQNTVNVQFKELGIKLNFQSGMLDDTHFRLELESEVFSLDYGAGVTVEGLVIPGSRVRCARTVLELRDGQSFALTGLLDNTEQPNLAKTPALDEMPILSDLFRSRRYQRNESDLIFLVTIKREEGLNPNALAKSPGLASGAEIGATSPTPVLPAAGIQGLAGHAIQSKSNAPLAESLAKRATPGNDISVQVETNSTKPETKSERKANEKPE